MVQPSRSVGNKENDSGTLNSTTRRDKKKKLYTFIDEDCMVYKKELLESSLVQIDEVQETEVQEEISNGQMDFDNIIEEQIICEQYIIVD